MFRDDQLDWAFPLYGDAINRCLDHFRVRRMVMTGGSVNPYEQCEITGMSSRIMSIKRSLQRQMDAIEAARNAAMNPNVIGAVVNAAVQAAAAQGQQQGQQQQQQNMDVDAVMEWYDEAGLDDRVELFSRLQGQGKKKNK